MLTILLQPLCNMITCQKYAIQVFGRIQSPSPCHAVVGQISSMSSFTLIFPSCAFHLCVGLQNPSPSASRPPTETRVQSPALNRRLHLLTALPPLWEGCLQDTLSYKWSTFESTFEGTEWIYGTNKSQSDECSTVVVNVGWIGSPMLIINI